MTDYVRYMRGRLVGPGGELAPVDEEHPYLEWTSAPTLADAGEGRITILGTENFTVRTADSIGFRAAPMSSGARTWTHLKKTRRRSKTIRLDLEGSMGRDRRGLHDLSPTEKASHGGEPAMSAPARLSSPLQLLRPTGPDL